jgi:hypothetical protein
MVLTAKDALVITPTVALVKDKTRLACGASPNNLSTNPLAYLNSAAPMRTTIGISPPREGQPLFAGDISGYSRLMGLDEEGTLRQLKVIERN